MAKKISKIEITFRKKWWQVWLPKTITLAYNLDPINEVRELANDLRASAIESDRVLMALKAEAEAIDLPVDKLDAPDPDAAEPNDPMVEYFEEMDRDSQLKEDAKQQPKQIHVMDEAESEGVTGGDFKPEVENQVVEYDPYNAAQWSPEQEGSVIIAQPPLINAMKTRAANDMRRMQDKRG